MPLVFFLIYPLGTQLTFINTIKIFKIPESKNQQGLIFKKQTILFKNNSV